MGKSALAMRLAQRFDGEIVNADSRQVYRYMDIGTAKSSLGERARVPHHLVNVVDPNQDFSLAMFLHLAHEGISDIRGRGRLPIVVGGTGQYVWALAEGWRPPDVPPNRELRRELEEIAKREGGDALYQRLLRVDRDAASRIDPRNLRRVIRALEIHQSAGVVSSARRGVQITDYRTLIIGLTTSREELYHRIDRRVDEMMEQGLIEEVQGLLDKGYSSDLPSMSSMGYKEMAAHLRGDLSTEEAIQRMKYSTHRFVRRQYTWFRLTDPRVHWLDWALASTSGPRRWSRGG